MTSIQQRAALQRQIWAIANDVRGSVDGWDFKQYVLGTLFYRFISENFTDYIEAGDDSINYAALGDDIITADIKDDAIKTKGYFIYPSQLFANIAASATTNETIAENYYNHSVSSYVEPKDTREVIDITELNAQLKTTVAKIDTLRTEIDAIVAEIEGEPA